MNERIRELARQVGFYISIDGAGIFIPDPHTEDITEVTKKFAELIVKECAELVDRAISDGGVDGRVLKQHFGVEE